jgi:hypothetical protein
MDKTWFTLMVGLNAKVNEFITKAFKLLYDTVQLSYPTPPNVYVAIVMVSIGWMVGGTRM